MLTWYICNFYFKYVDEKIGYLCGYIKVKESPDLITHFNGHLFNKKGHFSERNYDFDEELNIKHWVRNFLLYNSKSLHIFA